MDKFTRETLTVSRGYEYAYYTYQPSSSTTKPTLLLCHGWPDSHELYAGVVPSLMDLGHPILVPDCLGYGGTSKPTDHNEYGLKAMAHDIYDILAAEKVDKIVSVGHDWGSALAQRVYLFNPGKCVGVILLSVAYMPPTGGSFDLDLFNKMTENDASIGYPCFAYWDVFAADDGPKLLLDNVETLFHALHWDDPQAMRTFFATYGNTRKLLQTTEPSAYPLKPYAQAPGFKDAFITRMKRDGFEGPQCWYKAMARNVNSETEKDIPKESLVIKVPCLYIGATEDAVCRTDRMEQVKQLVSDLTQKAVEANHWLTFEKPEEVGGMMREWLKQRF